MLERRALQVTSRWTASATDADVKVALDLTTKVWTFGDHGLSSIWVDQREGQHWLYATYMVLPARSTVGLAGDWMPALLPETQHHRPSAAHDLRFRLQEAYCRDYGRLDGRNTADIAGCLSFARFSRWPLGDDGITNGPEQVIINGEKKVSSRVAQCGCPPRAQVAHHDVVTVCAAPLQNQHGSYLASAQFATDGITSCAQSDTDPTTMYISIGDGAADSTADVSAAQPLVAPTPSRAHFNPCIAAR